MKRYIIFFFILIFSLSAQASYTKTGKDVVLDEGFDNNNNGWAVGDWGEGSAERASIGSYNFKHAATGSYFSTIDKNLDYSRDYEIEGGMQWMNGDNNYGFGIAWGYKDPNDTHFFYISANGFFTIGNFRGGTLNSLKPWTESSAVKKDVNLNYLRVNKNGSTWSFYINDTFVYSCAVENLGGKNFGCTINETMQVNYYRYNINYMTKTSNSYTSNYSSNSNNGSDEYVINDNFDNNDYGWLLGSWEDGLAEKSAAGAYSFKHWKTGTYFSTIDKGFDANRDYEIVVGMQWMEGDNDGYGITFGYEDPSNANVFNSSPNGYYLIGNYQNGSFNSIKDWTLSSAIKTQVNLNYLKVVKKGSTISYYINDTFLYSGTAPKWYGNRVGMSLTGTMKTNYYSYKFKYLGGSSNSYSNTNNQSSNQTSSNYNSSSLTELFNDGFDNNTNNWPTETVGSANSKFDNAGSTYWYRVENTKSDVRYNTTISKPFDSSKDFEIVGALQWMSGTKDYGFGIAYGFKNNDNNLTFTINSSGSFKVSKWENGDVSPVIDWTESSAIKQNVNLNYLKVKKTGSKYDYYINDSWVGTSTAYKFFGDNVGFVVNADQAITMFRFSIKGTAGTNNDSYTSKSYNSNLNKYNNNNLNTNTTTYKTKSTDKNVVFEDLFETKNSLWPVGNWDEGSAAYENGAYRFEHTTETGAYTITTPVNFDDTRNYEIEAELKWLKGYDNHGYGLLFGYKDGDNQLKFMVTATGYWQVLESNKGEVSTILDWKTDDAVNKNVGINILKIKKLSDVMEYYINGKFVGESAILKNFGTEIGFVVNLNQAILISNLTVKYLDKNEKRKSTTKVTKREYYTNNENVKEKQNEKEKELNSNNESELVISSGNGITNPNAVALIIGIDKYSDPNVPTVSYAKNDAKLMRQYLINVLGYDPKNILPQDEDQLITTGTFKTLVKSTLGSYLKSEGKSDLFIYYSGHGAPSSDGQAAFFVPYDCDPNRISQYNGYEMKEFYEDIKKFNARTKTIVIDACFSGSSGGGTLIRGASAIYKVSKNETKLDDKTVLIQSSQADQVSNWYDEKKHGMFTYFFLKGLKGDADKNKDGDITVEEVEKYVNDVDDGLPYYANREYQRKQQANFVGAKKNKLITKKK